MAIDKTKEIDKTENRHVIAAIVDNEFGVLARVVGLFSGRGYNIESLTVAEISSAKNLSRVTIVTSGTAQIIEQIKALLERLIPVHSVEDISLGKPFVERELALLKVTGQGENRREALRMADVFRAKVVDSTADSFVFEITGTPSKLDAFIKLMQPLGLAELCRTGIAAVQRGVNYIGIDEHK